MTPYLVIIWAAAAIRSKKVKDPEVPAEINDFVFAILVIASVTLGVRLIIFLWRTVKQPLEPMESS